MGRGWEGILVRVYHRACKPFICLAPTRGTTHCFAFRRVAGELGQGSEPLERKWEICDFGFGGRSYDPYLCIPDAVMLFLLGDPDSAGVCPYVVG